VSLWEIIGTVLGIVGVWLMIRQSIWGWPVGLVQVSVYAWVFFDVRLYSDAILQGFFFVIQVYGWWHWLRGGETVTRHLPVTTLSSGARLGWLASGAAVTAGWGELMRRTTDAALPHWDAFILMFSLISQWLQARKHLDCWAGWMIVNVVAIGVYWAKDLRLTSGLYLMFLVMAALGWREWRRSMNSNAA
jgi:nicotinamide mononucleotide transporter